MLVWIRASSTRSSSRVTGLSCPLAPSCACSSPDLLPHLWFLPWTLYSTSTGTLKFSPSASHNPEPREKRRTLSLTHGDGLRWTWTTGLSLSRDSSRRARAVVSFL